MAILDLKDSRMGAAQIMNLLETKDVSDKFDLSPADMGVVEQWVRETNIRWGIDASSREKSGTPPLKDNTWQAGIERLLLGYAMPEKREELFSEILPYDHIEGKDGLVLGRFLDFMDRIIDFIEQVETERDLDQWNGFLNRLLDDFFLPNKTSEAEVLTLRRIIAGLPLKKEIAGFNEAIGVDVIRTYLRHCLDGEVFGHGFISGGVTFCAMLPMRSIPFKVVCLIGMNTDAFPREDRPVGFDLIHQHPQRGDRSRRKDDKYLFLEALISARNRLYISYVGQSIQDNSTRPPSVLVSELIDYLERGFGIKADRLVIRHRLQAFSPAYFQSEKELFSYSEENLKACAGLLESQRQPKPPTPFISTALHMAPEEAEDRNRLDIPVLTAFYSNPARYLLQKRLGVYLAEDLPQVEERENFELSPLEKYAIGQDLVNKQISGVALDSLQGVLKARGLLPHGTVGDVCYNRLSAEVETFLRQTAQYTDDHCLDPLNVEMNLAGIHLIGKLGNIYKEKMIRRVYANFKPKYLLNTWIYHILLNVSNEENYPLKTLLMCRDGVWEFLPLSQSRKIIIGLLKFYQAGLIQPVRFFSDSSYAYTRQLLEKNKSEKRALSAAENIWNGSDFVRGERQDPYYERCFGWMEPQTLFDQTFQKTALEIFGPLMTHSRKFAW
jgi:exodeoxyribonuclease V gamma subunit